METYDPRRKQKDPNRARARQEARQRRRDGAMAVPRERREAEPAPHVAEAEPPKLSQYAHAAQLWARDALWYLRHNPTTWKIGAGVIVAAFALFILSHLLTGRIFPNVWALGVNLGGQTVEEATAALNTYWADEYRLTLSVDGEVLSQVSPAELGLRIDAQVMAEAAKGAGLSGIPFGALIEPTVALDYMSAERFMLAQAQAVNIQPFNAGFAWENGQVVGVRGTDGRELNVSATLERVQATLLDIVQTGRLNLLTTPIPPAFVDPEPLLAQARAITSGPFTFTSYDPFSDTTSTWATQPEHVVKWLQAGAGELIVREDAFKEFIRIMNDTIAASDPTRYIDHEESRTVIQTAINQQQNSVTLRYRYRPQVYKVEGGDTAYRIARKTGVPFFKLLEVNPDRNLEELYPGDEVNLPPRDVTLPQMPIATKRIVVNLNTQQLYAFENGQLKYRWQISSGRDTAPTSPGTYQILNHDELAIGSSYTLCSADTCGQWKMYWFMGIYEIQPGLVNGFHGAVELPNGSYLGGGGVDYPSTFGCIMSLNDLAKELYDWAEVGTMVEIISNEYLPQSELGRKVWNNQV